MRYEYGWSMTWSLTHLDYMRIWRNGFHHVWINLKQTVFKCKNTMLLAPFLNGGSHKSLVNHICHIIDAMHVNFLSKLYVKTKYHWLQKNSKTTRLLVGLMICTQKNDSRLCSPIYSYEPVSESVLLIECHVQQNKIMTDMAFL